MSVKIFSFIFLKTIVTILKLLKSIYNDVSKTKKKLFLFFGGLLCANTHYNKTRTQKKIYLSIYIIYMNNVTLRIWLPIQQQLFFQCHNSRCWDGKNVSSYELLWRTRIYSCNVGSMINILLTYLYFLKRIWPGKEMYRYFTCKVQLIIFSLVRLSCMTRYIFFYSVLTTCHCWSFAYSVTFISYKHHKLGVQLFKSGRDNPNLNSNSNIGSHSKSLRRFTSLKLLPTKWIFMYVVCTIH